MLHPWFALVSWLVVVATTVAAGGTLYRLLHLPATRLLDRVVLGAGLGLLMIIYGTALLGVASLLTPIAVYVLLGGLALLGVAGLPDLRREWQVPSMSDRARAPEEMHLSPAARCAIASALLVLGVTYLLSTMAPPLDGDTLHAYLDVPMQYVRAGRIV